MQRVPKKPGPTFGSVASTRETASSDVLSSTNGWGMCGAIGPGHATAIQVVDREVVWGRRGAHPLAIGSPLALERLRGAGFIKAGPASPHLRCTATLVDRPTPPPGSTTTWVHRRTTASNDLENLRATRLGHEQGELVAAEPGDRVVFAQSLSKAPSDLSQHLIAGRVAERVVDLLEPNQVHYQHGQLTAALLRLGDRLSDALVKEGAIGEPGERVVQGVIANLPLDALARLVCRLLPRDVEDHADCPLSTAIRAQNWPAVLGDPPRLPPHVDQPPGE